MTMEKLNLKGILVSRELFKTVVRGNLPPTEKDHYVVLSQESLREMVQYIRKTGADFRVNAEGEGNAS